MYFYLIKAEQEDDWGKIVGNNVMLSYHKKLSQEQFDLLFDKIYTEWSQSDTTNENIAKEMEENLGFKIVKTIGIAYVVELGDGKKYLVHNKQEVGDGGMIYSGNMLVTSDKNRGNGELYENENLSEEEYNKAYVASLKKIVGE